MKKKFLFLAFAALMAVSATAQDNLQPAYATRDNGYQMANIQPIDMKNDGTKQILFAGWYNKDSGDNTARFGSLLTKAGSEWTIGTTPFDIGFRPSLTCCDFNGDGIMDVVMFDSTNNDATEGIYLGNGDGTFAELPYELVDASAGLPSNFTGPITSLRSIISGDVADFNNDGLPDIVGIGPGAATCVLLNQGIVGGKVQLKPIYFDNGIVKEEETYPGRNFANGMVFAADFNNDGFADILVSSDNGSRQNYNADWERFTEVYLNDGTGTKFNRTYFAKVVNPDTQQNPSVSNGGVAIADFNNDGYLDLFLQGPGGYFWYYWDHTYVCLNDGTGHFTPVSTSDFDRFDLRNQNSTSVGAQAYDWDGDGLIDIIYQGWCPSDNTQSGFIWLNGNNGNAGSFARKYRWAGGSEGATNLVDWDGDGIKDIIHTGWTTNGNFVSSSNNGRTMTVTSGSVATSAPSAPAAVNAVVEGHQVTLSWTPAEGAPKSMTYELYIKDPDGTLLGSPRAYISGEREGQRKCEAFGNQGCVTTITYTLPDGAYEWGVQAVDGRRVGSTFAKGAFVIKTDDIVVTDALMATYYNSSAVRLPAGLKAATIDGVNGYQLEVNWRYDGDDAAKRIVPAGTAVLLSADAADYTLNLIDGDESVAPVGNLLFGSDVETTTTGGDVYYKLAYSSDNTKLGFFWGAENGAAFVSPAHKAWLALPAASAKSGFYFDGTTAINEELRMKNEELGPVYNLQGQRVANTQHPSAIIQKGVYIINGKKVVK